MSEGINQEEMDRALYDALYEGGLVDVVMEILDRQEEDEKQGGEEWGH